MHHHSTHLVNGKVILLLDGWKKSDKENTLFVQSVDSEGNIVDDRIALEKAPGKSFLKGPSFKVTLSPDQSKLLVLTQMMHKKKQKEKIRLQVFSTTDFSSIWKKDLVLENDSKKNRRYNSIAVNNDGTAYMYKYFKLGKSNYQHQLWTTNKSLAKTSNINLENRFPISKYLMINEQGQLEIFSAVQPLDLYRKGISGTWHLLANTEGEMLSSKIEPLSTNILSKFLTENQAKKENIALADIFVKDVLHKSDGSSIMILEKQKVDSKLVRQNPTVYQKKYDFGSIIVLSFDKDGNRTSDGYYKKSQVFQTTSKKHFGSIAYTLVNDELYIFWNYIKDEYTTAMENLFSSKMVYPLLLSGFTEDDSSLFPGEEKECVPIPGLLNDDSKFMAVDPSIFFPTPKGIVLLSRMRNEGPGSGYYMLSKIQVVE